MCQRCAVVPNPFRVKLLRGLWNPSPPGSHGQWPWSAAFCRAIFQGPYLYSLSEYWRRSSFGVINLQFDLDESTPFPLTGLDGGYLRNVTDEAIEAVKSAARHEGLRVDGYDAITVLINPPPCNSKGGPGRVLLDQGGRLEHFQHETGHLLGFQHAFGPDSADPDIDTVYEDPYCVMGDWSQNFTAPQSPEATALVTPLPANFWRTSRRLAVANMYRAHADSFAAWVQQAGLGDPAVIGAASAVAEIGSPVVKPLAVYRLSGADGELTIEYRVPTVDDEAVAPAVVVHTIGYRQLAPPGSGLVYGEDRPIWYEGTLAPVGGSTLSVGPYRISVEGTDFPGFGLGPRPPVVRVRVLRV
jgi:hypothetical protein